MLDKQGKIGITLSGGGARGLAHVGVLQALEDHGIVPEVICGTSAGAILGVLYASGMSPGEILDVAELKNSFKLFSLVLPRRGLSSQDYVFKQLQQIIPENSFDVLQKKFFVGVTNLNTGRHEVLEDGPLSEAVIASSAIPGVFQCVEIGGQYYVDGGVLNNMPAHPIRTHCDFLIGSNVTVKMEKTNAELGNLKSILARVFEVSLSHRSWLNYDSCDMIIECHGLQNFSLFNFTRAREIYQVGYESACAQIARFSKEKSQVSGI